MKDKKLAIKEGQEKNEFNALRTPFWISFGFLLIESIIPALLVWFLMGKDFEFSQYKNLSQPKELWVVLACLLVIGWSIFSTGIAFHFKWHESDNFTYAFIASMVLTSFVYNGLWMENSRSGIVLKVFLAVLILIGSGILGAMLTAFMRNRENRRQEDFKVMYEAYKNGEEIPEKSLLKIRRYEENAKSNEEKQIELEQFKKELQLKISQELLEREKSQKEYRAMISKQNEEKERDKLNKKNTKNSKKS